MSLGLGLFEGLRFRVFVLGRASSCCFVQGLGVGIQELRVGVQCGSLFCLWMGTAGSQ